MSTKNVRCATGSRLLGMIWTVRLRHQNIAEFLPKFLEFLSIRLDFINTLFCLVTGVRGTKFLFNYHLQE